jgi:peptide/nickel transport system substrate-binding protein
MRGMTRRKAIVRLAIAGTGALVFLSTTLAGAFAQTATPSTSASGSASQGVAFTYADTSEPSSLNPMVGYLGTDYTFWAMTYDLPINFSTEDFSADLDHSLVTSVDSAEDGMTFTYHLRPDVKWSDGEPFSADDVVWTLNYYKTNNVSNYSTDLELFKDAETIDANTFELHTTQPTSFFSGDSVFMYEYILPQHIWSKYDDDYKGARHDKAWPAVGTGPFIITNYVKGQFVELDRNPYYWGNSIGLTPQVDKIVYQIFNNEDAEAAALSNGEIDFAYIDSANILNTLKSKPGISTRGAVVPSFDEIGINTGSAFQTDKTGGFAPHGDGALALTDVRVRQAMRMAVDNDTLVSRVLQGYGSAWASPVQPGATTGTWEPGPDDPDLSFNLDSANALLDEAGYTMGPDGVRIDPNNNQPLEFRYFTRSGDQNTIKTAPFVHDWFEQIGIKLDVQSVTSDKLANIILAGEYDLFDWGWYPNPDPNSILAIFTCDQRPPDENTYRNSDSYYCNKDFDEMFKQQEAETDPVARADIVHQMQSLLYSDSPYLVKWNSAVLEAYNSDKWTGFVPQPAGDTGDLLATYGPLSFVSVRLAAGASSGTTSSGISAWVWVAIAVAVIAVIAIFLLARRRKEAAEDAA